MPIGIYERSIDARKNIGLAAEGRVPWNKGVHLYCGGRRFEKGHIPWCKGKKRPDISGENNPMWKGGRNSCGIKGYIQVYNPKHPCVKNGRNYVLEHRSVVEKHIGRFLLTKEQVHHLGRRDDNRPEMLMAFVDNSAHARFECGEKVKPEEIIFDGRNLKKENDNGKK